jgi:pseudouridine-5'-phosphate glycosidase
MAVVCAGAKSILDIPRTLEVLVRDVSLTDSSERLMCCRRLKAYALRHTVTSRTFRLSTLQALACRWARPPWS